MFSKKSLSILFLGFTFLMFFSFVFTENTQAAIVGENCTEENSCTDGTYCLTGRCRLAFDAKLGETCIPTSEMPAGTVCSDGISFCYEGECAEKCVVPFGELCNTTDQSKRCYPTKENPQISICKKATSINFIDSPCGIIPNSFCKQEEYDSITTDVTCGENLNIAWRGFMCSPNEEGIKLVCCEPAADVKKPTCPDLTYGQKCDITGVDYYCYDGICEPEEPKGEIGDLCGDDGGGVCMEDAPGWLNQCPNGTEHDATGGRSCGSGLYCCMDNNTLPESTCINKKNGETCGDDGFCYDGTCSDFGSAGLGEKCGYDVNATCKEGIPDNLNSRWYCDVGEKEEHGGRKCNTTLYNGNPLRCCSTSPPATPSTPNPIVIQDFYPEYQTCAGTQPSEGITGGMGLFKGSIVPCGRSCDDLGTPTNEMNECTICHFILMGKRIYDFVLSLLVIVSIVMLTASGILYMFSGANPGLKSTAKEIVKKTLLGFALFLGSWLIVNTVLILISANTDLMGNGDGTGWYNFSCNTTSKFQIQDDEGRGIWNNPNNLNIPTN